MLLAAGLVFGGLLLSGVAVPEWRMNHDFLPATCTILGKGLVRRTAMEPAGTSPSTWQPCLRVSYTADGRPLEAWSRPSRSTLTSDRDVALDKLSAWRIGDTIPGWYDPADPGTIVIERGYNWWMWLLALLLPGALVAFGGSGLARTMRRWGRSEERCAVPSRLTDILDPLAAVPRQAPDHPGVPSCDDMMNSPGTFLAYRLPIESPESWALLGFGLFALLWNGVLAVLAVGAGLDLLGGRTDWLLLTLLVPFAVVGIAGIAVFARGLLLATAVGPTQLEISAQPLRPGGTYEVLLAQGGSGTLASLEMTLELEEQATFRQGTDTRTERLTVWRQPIHAWHDLSLAPGTRFEGRATVTIPEAAMHSFASEHNAARWSIAVRGTSVRWPPFTRTFPLVVFPAESRGKAAMPARSRGAAS
ncbi:MAG: hypothetical protein K8S94_12865 [Planctomycetia bacterium]|nr:hypothetical protein [Planctomycetia bacterium]